MQVHYGEGVAIHTGPKPCAGLRKGVGEAPVGECIGQPLSREILVNQGADVVPLTEGEMGRRGNASICLTLRGLRPWHVRTLLVREPEISGSAIGPIGRNGPWREGEEP